MGLKPLEVDSDGNPTFVIGDPMKKVQWVKTSRRIRLILGSAASCFAGSCRIALKDSVCKTRLEFTVLYRCYCQQGLPSIIEEVEDLLDLGEFWCCRQQFWVEGTMKKKGKKIELRLRFQILAMACDVDGVGCSSSSSASTKRWKYDVFLSFRGEDSRKNFTDHLYVALKRKGLRTFRDEEELERGEYINPGLVQAIDESRSAIVVLSPNYASSTWCLDELQKILQLKEELSLQVFPIFYRVDPSDVRKQKGCFAEAFIKYEERFVQDKMKVRKWRDALEKVATISGWDSQNWHETEFIESIAEEIMSKLRDDELPSDLGMLIGIQPKLDELESIVARELGGVGFIGIWGTGGIGKTTLARAFYERKLKNFEIHCFLHNIREAYEKEGLISLQKRLLFSLEKRSMEVCDCYEGMKLIKNMLRNRKVLLVLDDVSDISQLENLAPKQGWFSKGSIIIITTRDKHLLSSHGVSTKYDVKFLSDNESLELFLQKAFKGDKPNEDYLNLARTVIEYARGLPLALKVLGSFLCKRTIVQWKHALAKFKKVPPNDILKILQSLQSLKSIDLSYLEYLIKTPNFDRIPHLEKLILEGCSNLIEIHRSLGQHKKLVIVNLKDCREVKNLPRKFEMNCLETFVLSGCSRVIKLPEFGKDMERLSKLDLEGTAITKLSQSLGNLIGLVELNLKNCKKLVCLPCDVCKLKSLKMIKIAGCSKFSSLTKNLNEKEAVEVLDLRKIAIKRLSLCEYNGQAQSSSSWSCFSLIQRPLSCRK
ncbi:TMV resistance protein N-like [Neltuma alba]|uniref:TMV resistance protein N-like n=1 Tax=Neltuma alba TaxID=207710 RepID=UPI0010A4F08A|nr:TMV resistance protein N-like [Prosopis alba]